MLRASDAHRMAGARAFIDHLDSIGGLRAGLDRAEAARPVLAGHGP